MTKDGFKWFGEGFDGFPKTIPDDTVEYSIYVLGDRAGVEDASGATGKADSLLAYLRKIKDAADSILSEPALSGYIWQRDRFNLQLKQDILKSPHLQGRVNFGDSVEDNWLVVYILRELSLKFADVWIRTIDSYGEFLLVEAANSLPSWINPDNDENRVWIHDGRLLLIPLENEGAAGKMRKDINGSQQHDKLSILEAFKWIQDPEKTLQHSKKVQAAAFARLEGFPDKLEKSNFFTRVAIPRKLAYILRSRPSFISVAIEAFYLRDPISLLPIKKAKHDKDLNLPPNDLVTVTVKFTKLLYAQLRCQQFDTTCISPVYRPLLSLYSESKPQRQDEIGFRLTCGFEMLLQDSKSKDSDAVLQIKSIMRELESGRATLPLDVDLETWSQRDDDDTWLNVDFASLEGELTSKNRQASSKADDMNRPTTQNFGVSGFGDAAMHQNLQRVIDGMQKAGDLDSEQSSDDFDNDDSDSDDDIQDNDIDQGHLDEDKNRLFNKNSQGNEGEDSDMDGAEADFNEMMRKIMGMPKDVLSEMMNMQMPTGSSKEAFNDAPLGNSMEKNSSDLNFDDENHSSDFSDEEIASVMAQTTQELAAAGIFDSALVADDDE